VAVVANQWVMDLWFTEPIHKTADYIQMDEILELSNRVTPLHEGLLIIVVSKKKRVISLLCFSHIQGISFNSSISYRGRGYIKEHTSSYASIHR